MQSKKTGRFLLLFAGILLLLVVLAEILHVLSGATAGNVLYENSVLPQVLGYGESAVILLADYLASAGMIAGALFLPSDLALCTYGIVMLSSVAKHILRYFGTEFGLFALGYTTEGLVASFFAEFAVNAVILVIALLVSGHGKASTHPMKKLLSLRHPVSRTVFAVSVFDLGSRLAVEVYYTVAFLTAYDNVTPKEWLSIAEGYLSAFMSSVIGYFMIFVFVGLAAKVLHSREKHAKQ